MAKTEFDELIKRAIEYMEYVNPSVEDAADDVIEYFVNENPHNILNNICLQGMKSNLVKVINKRLNQKRYIPIHNKSDYIKVLKDFKWRFNEGKIANNGTIYKLEKGEIYKVGSLSIPFVKRGLAEFYYPTEWENCDIYKAKYKAIKDK